MITIAEIVNEIISESPFLEEALNENLINISSLARKIKPDVEKRLRKEIKEGAIVMAINRLPVNRFLKISKTVNALMKEIGDIIVRSDLMSYTFLNSFDLRKKQTSLMQQLQNSLGAFYTFSQGISETTIIISKAYENQMEGIFKEEQLIKKTTNLSSVILKLPEINSETPGLYYFILKNLAWEGVNINEVISTSNEFTIVVSDTDISKAFLVLLKLKKGL